MSPVPNPRRLAAKEEAERERWWHKRSWSMLVFVLVVSAMGLLALKGAFDVSDTLPEVSRDAEGADPWTVPIGVEKASPFTIARIPDCAPGPVVRIALWDEESKPYWEVSGPPTPMTSFVVGVTPEGFTEEVAYDEPPPGALLRLVVIRRLTGAAGVRYRASDLRTGRVLAGLPLSRYTPEGFQTAEVCETGDDGTTGTTSTTLGG